MSDPSRRRWFRDRHIELRDLVWEWDPLSLNGAPEDEYDFLVDAVLGELARGGSDAEVSARIDLELGESFGPASAAIDPGDFLVSVRRWFEGAPDRPRV